VGWAAVLLPACLAAFGATLAQSAGDIQALVDRYAAGWNVGEVVHDDELSIYTGAPRFDEARDWLVYVVDGDVRIFNRRDLRLEARLPPAINSREREFDPSLIRTHVGRHALLWSRGTGATRAKRFVSFSDDLVRWTAPDRLVFDEPSGDLGYTYSQAEPLERTYNVAAVQTGYAMLLAQGFLRYSSDLKQWGPPLKMLPQDLWRNRLIDGGDGTIWAIVEASSAERQPYTPEDWLHGSFGIGDKQYRHLTEIGVSRSVDGRTWQEMGRALVPGQPSGLWVFVTDDHRVGIAAGFNNLFVRWFIASPAGTFVEVDAGLQLFNQTDQAELFVQNGRLICVRPLRDPKTRKPILLSTTTTRWQ
jgi:hypothetical protein